MEDKRSLLALGQLSEALHQDQGEEGLDDQAEVQEVPLSLDSTSPEGSVAET